MARVLWLAVPLLLVSGCTSPARAKPKAIHHTVGYSVLTTGGTPGGVQISYTDGSGSVQDVKADGAWTETVEVDTYIAVMVLTASSPSAAVGGVECIIQVDGKTIDQHSGQYVAQCNYAMPQDF
jgi:hypothetical protein